MAESIGQPLQASPISCRSRLIIRKSLGSSSNIIADVVTIRPSVTVASEGGLCSRINELRTLSCIASLRYE